MPNYLGRWLHLRRALIELSLTRVVNQPMKYLFKISFVSRFKNPTESNEKS